jgi:hypothetical protein
MKKPDVSKLACNDQSPEHPEVAARVRCNRIAKHSGPHRKIDPYNFETLVEWADHKYMVLPKKKTKR